MARFLAIDWEQQQLHIVVGSAGRRSAVIERVLTWPLTAELTPASAEQVGHGLRDALKKEGISASCVLATIGRDRVILKEIHHPPVPASEEAALVRFQTAKELSESPDSVVIDYTPLSDPKIPGERVAMAMVVRKEILRALQGLCRGAGLKLLAVAPRPSAMAGALERSRAGVIPLGAIDAVAVVGPRWAELVVLRGQTILLARALAVGPALATEIKRNLAVFSSQSGLPVQAFFLANNGDQAALFQSLHESLGIPVHQLDPLTSEDASVPAGDRSRYLPGVGILHLWASTTRLPINFVAPKEPVAAAAGNRRIGIWAGVAAAAVLLAAGIYANRLIADRKDRINQLNTELAAAKSKYNALAQDIVDVNSLKEWEQTTVPWLDEFYDLSEHFPRKLGLRVMSLTASPLNRKTPKANVAHINLRVMGDPRDEALIGKFVEELNRDPHMRAVSQGHKGNGEFIIAIDIAKQPLSAYTTRLTPPPPRERPKENEGLDPLDLEGGEQ